MGAMKENLAMGIGRVLSQGEIDNMLQSILEDSTVLPDGEVAVKLSEPSEMFCDDNAEPAIPAGIAAFKAKLEAAQAARDAGTD
jgi:hypothetical protein